MVVLEGKKGKYKLGIIPCSAGVFPRLIEVSASEKTYMLAEELILHFIPKVFEGYAVKAKSLIRVTRNADIDADALYDDDLDYREFMVQLIKRRKRLAPVRWSFPANWTASSSIRCADTWMCRANTYSRAPRRWICLFCSAFRIFCASAANCFIRSGFRRNRRSVRFRQADSGADSRKG